MLPIALDVADWPVILAGSGPLAVKRLAILDAAGAKHVTVYAPDADGDLSAASGGRLVARLPGDTEIASAKLMLVAGLTDAQSGPLAAAARRHRVLLNVEDDLPRCDFHMPAIVRRGDLVIAVSTGGHSPTLASRIRQFLGHVFGPEWADRLRRAAALRTRMRQEGADNRAIVAAVNALADDEQWFQEKPKPLP